MKPATQNVLIKLTVEGVNIEGAVALPTGPVPRHVILPALQSLTESVIGIARARVEEEGEKISCRKGCCSCCYQMVPIAPSEAFALAAHLDALPAGESAPILERFDRAMELLAHAGLLAPLRHRGMLSHEHMGEVDRAYFEADIPCPFLENDACTIHPVRPLVCREYVVTSDPAICEHPYADKVNRVRLGACVSKALAQSENEWVPLVLAREYVAQHHPSETRDAAKAITDLLKQLEQ